MAKVKKRTGRREGDRSGGSSRPPTGFYLLAVLSPLLLFLAVELALRAGGSGGAQSLFVLDDTGLQFETNPDVIYRYFSNRDGSAPTLPREHFSVAKQPGTARIFCLGASTTAGFPYQENPTFPILIQQRLQEMFPDQKLEVLNLGVAAVMSYTVLDFARESLRHEPDLLVVYMGHNEFYGVLGAGSTLRIGNSRGAVRFVQRLRSLRTFQIGQKVMESVAGRISRQSERSDSQEQTLMESMAGDRAIALDSPLFASAVSTFEQNLSELLEAAADRDVPVVVCTLVSNEKDQAPFVSVFADGSAVRWEVGDEVVSESEVANESESQVRCRALHRRAIAAIDRASWGEAAALLDSALAIDPAPSRLHFLLGQTQLELGRSTEAARALARARDLDALRFRAPSRFNAVIRAQADRPGVYLADVEEAFRAHSPSGIPGQELLLEHVHPNAQGYFLIAQTVVEAVAAGRLPPFDWSRAQPAADSTLWSLASVTALDERIADFHVAVLQSRWPFASEAREIAFEVRGSLDRLAAAVGTGRLAWSVAHVQWGDSLARAGDFINAIPEYRTVALRTRDRVEPWIRLGDACDAVGRLDEAASAFERARLIQPLAAVELRLGTLYFRSEEPARAIPFLRRAVSSVGSSLGASEEAMGRYMLAVCLARGGEFAEARESAARALQLAPADERIRLLYATLTQ